MEAKRTSALADKQAVPLEQADEKRQRAALPDLNLSIELQRVEAIDPATLPAWLATAIAAQAAE